MEEKLNMQKSEIQIVWFKRDLRISDHQPLFDASKDLLPLLPIYFVEPEYWNKPFAIFFSKQKVCCISSIF